MSDEIFNELIQRHPALVSCAEAVQKAFILLSSCYEKDGVVYLCGNGGSAADAEHIVGELMKSFSAPRPLSAEALDQIDDATISSNLEGALRAISFSGQVSLSSAIANDVRPDLVFAQQVYGYGRPGDILWALSTSGDSPNIINALKVAKARGLFCLGMTGASGGKVKALCDACICVPETETFKVQELHLPVYHALCRMLEKRFF